MRGAGQYPARLGLTDWIPGIATGRARLEPPQSRKHLAVETVTIAEALADAGYATGYFGKWHLGGEGQQPTDHGFAVAAGSGHLGRVPSHFYPYGQGRSALYGLGEGRNGDYLADRLTDEALGFIDAVGSRPFLLVLSHFAVHDPLQAKRKLVAKYRAKPPSGGHRNPVYAAMIQSIDESVGRILDRTDSLDSGRSSVVFLSSDNGGGLRAGSVYVTSNSPLRAGKGLPYEGGIRTPLIVRWPGVVPPGAVTDVPVTSVDFYPTFLELAGLPPQRQAVLDGLSLVPVLKQEGDLERKAIYWHYPHYSGSTPFGAVRAGDWKLIEFYEDMRAELYNLRDDLGEAHDLAASQPERAERLRRELQRWRVATGATMPRPNPKYRAGSGPR